MKRLVMEIDEVTHKEIKLQAVREGCSYRELIKRCFIEYMKHRDQSHVDQSLE